MKQHKHLSEAQAWRVVAKRYLTPTHAANMSYYSGLCGAVFRLSFRDQIDDGIKAQMEARIHAALPIDAVYACVPSVDNTVYPSSIAVDSLEEATDVRGMVALWFALDAEQDAREATP